MPDFRAPDNFFLLLAFVVPGVIITYFRAKLLTGDMGKHTDNFISYVVISAIYLFFIAFVFRYIGSDLFGSPVAIQFIVFVVGPIGVGVFLGASIKKGWLRPLAHWLKLTPTHGMPTAWDWKFSSQKPQWVLIHLKDGSEICGWLNENAFISSDRQVRDIYIHFLYKRDESTNEWQSKHGSSMWISGAEISWIQFWENSEV